MDDFPRTHILVNGLSARLGGGGSVIASHLRSLLLVGGAELKITVLVSDKSLFSIDDSRVHIVSVRRVPTPVRVLLEQVLVPILALLWRVDVVYCLGNVGLLLRSPRRQTVVLLQTAHYFSVLHPPRREALYSSRRRARYRFEAWFSRLTCSRASTICCVSRTLADAAHGSWPKLAEKVVTVSSVSPPFERGGATGIDAQPYCLFVANDYPHKEWCRVAHVFRGEASLPPLLLVGNSSRDRPCGLACSDDLDTDLERERVVWAGPIMDRQRLGALYRQAEVVVVHSLIEAGPLTIREALNTNSHIVASDLPAHREALAEMGLEARLYPPEDLKKLIEQIAMVQHEPRQIPDREGRRRGEIEVGRDLLAVLAPTGIARGASA